MDYEYKLFEFNTYNRPPVDEELSESNDGEEYLSDDNSNGDDEGPRKSKMKKDNKIFVIQMFGINELGEQASIIIENYKPFFYVKLQSNVSKNEIKNITKAFKKHILDCIGIYYENSVKFSMVKNKKLYGFDNGTMHDFIKLTFNNTHIYDRVKKMWYSTSADDDGESMRKLISGGYKFQGYSFELYETSIPPLLRFFHIQEISPSGWIKLPKNKYLELSGENKTTTCHREFIIDKNNIISLADKNTPVPYKIMSFDIEASSSHGDFPVPIKTYKKLATNIVDHFDKKELNDYPNNEDKYTFVKNELKEIIQTAFGFNSMPNIDLVYPKTPIPNVEDLNQRIDKLLKCKVKDVKRDNFEQSIESYFSKMNFKTKPIDDDENTDDNADNTDDNADDNANDNANDNDINLNDVNYDIIDNATSSLIASVNATKIVSQEISDYTIIDIICNTSENRETKLDEIINLFSNKSLFPKLEGDKVTFIGSTFLKYGQKNAYLNHCFVLNSCDSLHKIIPNSVIEVCETERELLLSWTNLVSNRENPDMVTGYNIAGFDYEFMFRRSQELDCVEEFLNFSKNKNELCGNVDYKTGKIDIDRSLIVLASGAYDLSMIKMSGRLQVDMLNYFRRTELLVSYKLDFVSGYYLGDYVTRCEQMTEEVQTVEFNGDDNGDDDDEFIIASETKMTTKIHTNNMYGLQLGSYVHFEVIDHSSDYYKNGAKFIVTEINIGEKWFKIEGSVGVSEGNRFYLYG